jgi:uncharacterized membrane protein YhaH (DUF805 family)
MNLETFTSFNGRSPRKSFWLAILVMIVISWILQFIVFAIFGTGMMVDPNATPEAQMAALNAMWLPLGIVMLITLWPTLAIYTKRWHDRNKSGWWTLILLVPLIGFIWLLVELGFLRGTEGPNSYGPDPIVD